MESAEEAHSWTSSQIAVGRLRLCDQHGRRLLLRGVNMSGNSKLPLSPAGAAYPSAAAAHAEAARKDDHAAAAKLLQEPLAMPSDSGSAAASDPFFNHRAVSFVGRPFSLAEAPEHFERLRAWGLSFARLLVPWEAIEHAGPGIYDEQYIEHLVSILRLAPEYGIKCFIDPHQDTWSRFSGGSGAPGWTFEVVGMDITNFEAAGAAILHHFNLKDQAKMLWPTNYIKLASATMFTIFFAGDELAPNLKYNGESPQQFLQRHFCNAYAHLARRLKEENISAVVGFEVLNEPHPGYIGLLSLLGFDTMKDLHLDNTPCALESFALGSGIPQRVGHWIKSWPWPTRKIGSRLLNAQRKSAWLPGRTCVWRSHGVWDVDANGNPVVLKPDYFCKRRDGSKINFNVHCYGPFVKRYARAVTEAHPDMIVFFEPIPNEDPPEFISDNSPELSNLVFAPHWYDLKAVFNKSFDGFITHDVQGLSRGTKNVLQASYFGLTGAKRNYQNQISNIVSAGLKLLGPRPCLFGEVGIPMDINEKRAFETGDYAHHTNFLDAVISAMESNLVNFTLWNYNPHNDNMYGDHWNGEDFSIFSRSHSTYRPRPSLAEAAHDLVAAEGAVEIVSAGTVSQQIVSNVSATTVSATTTAVVHYTTPPNMSPTISKDANHHSISEDSESYGPHSPKFMSQMADTDADTDPVLLECPRLSDVISASLHVASDASSHISAIQELPEHSDSIVVTPTPSPPPFAQPSLTSSLEPSIRTEMFTTQPTVSKVIPRHVMEAEKHSSPTSVQRTALTPETPFEITELCYSNLDEFGHNHVGGRALDAVIRPYAAKIAGDPVKMRFDLSTLEFELYFTTPRDESDYSVGKNGCRQTDLCKSKIANTTEIYVPSFHYGEYDQPEISVSDGEWIYDRKRQTLYWTIDPCRQIEPWTDEDPLFSVWSWLFSSETMPPSETDCVNVHSIRIGVPKTKSTSSGWFW